MTQRQLQFLNLPQHGLYLMHTGNREDTSQPEGSSMERRNPCPGRSACFNLFQAAQLLSDFSSVPASLKVSLFSL